MPNIMACSKCGFIRTQDDKKKIGDTCNWCGGIFIELPISEEEYEENTHSKDSLHYSNHQCQQYKSSIYKKYIEHLDTLDKNCQAFKNNQIVMNEVPRYTIKEKPVIKCPTCGSTNVEKISTANKIGSALAIGVFSIGHISKTFRCKKCGYKW